MRLRILLVLFLAVSVLTALAGSPMTVCGSEVLPWGVERLHAQCVWDNNRDLIVDEGANAGQNVTVAVIDTGVDYYINGTGQKVYHPELRDNIAGGLGFRYVWQEDRVVDVEDYDDEGGHGTFVVGVIAAADNDVGLLGAAPKVEIYALKLCSSPVVVPQEVAAAIGWAVDNGIRVISMSFDLYVDYPDLHAACDYANDNGVLLVAAAGNFGISTVAYPARYSSVTAVGAVYPNDTRWEWSNTGSELDYVAPGVNITSTSLNEGYAVDSGTSFAVPHVAGAAALVMASKTDWDYELNYDGVWQNLEVLQMFQDWALDLGPPEWDQEYGFGLVNAWRSCQRPQGDINNDLRCNILDAIVVGNAFGSRPGSPRWDPRADLDINNVVNILDAMIIAENFGKVDP